MQENQKKNKTPLIVFIILLVLVIGLAVYLGLKLPNGNTDSNSNNPVSVTEADNVTETQNQDISAAVPTDDEAETLIDMDSELVQKLLFSSWNSANGEPYYLTIEEEEYGSLLSLEVLNKDEGSYLLTGAFYIDEAASVFHITETDGGYYETKYDLVNDNTLKLTIENKDYTFIREEF